MALERGWTKSRGELCGIWLLDWLDQKESADTFGSLSEFIDEREIEQEFARDALRRIESSGLVEAVGGIGDHKILQLTQAGRLDAATRRDNREDRSRRGAAIKEALVCWLNDQRIAGRHPANVSGVLNEPQAHYEGDSVPLSDFEDAAMALKDHGLIKVSETWPVSITRPELTRAGIEYAEDYGNDWRQHLASRHTTSGPSQHFHAPVAQVGQAAGNVYMTQTTGATLGEVADLLRAVREAAEQLPPADAEVVRAYATVIEYEVADEPEQERVEGAMDKIKTIAAKTGNASLTAAVGLLFQGLKTWLHWE